MYDARSWYRCSGRGLGRMESCSRGRYVSGVFLLSLDILIKRFFSQALLPPSTFLQVIPLLPKYTSPQIQIRKFKSGLSVLHTPSFSQSAFNTRLKAHLTLQGPKTTMEIALIEGITVALAREMINDAEINGDVVRDDAECVIQDVDLNGGGFASTGLGEAGVKWWPNVFIDYVWDGEKFDVE